MKSLLKAAVALPLFLMPSGAWAETSSILNDPSNVIVLPGAHSTDEPVTVASIGDGDTLRVSDGQQTTTIRIACIDAPEMKQAPHGEAARARLTQLLPIGSEVHIEAKATDRYGRTVAEVFQGKRNIGLSLVQEGQAVAYRQYLSNCDSSAYLSAEAQAQDHRVAFWQQPQPVMPWDYRRGLTTVAAVERDQCDPAYPDVCIPRFSVVGDLNCGDIVERRFTALPADPHGFDGDNDGIGCESN